MKRTNLLLNLASKILLSWLGVIQDIIQAVQQIGNSGREFRREFWVDTKAMTKYQH